MSKTADGCSETIFSFNATSYHFETKMSVHSLIVDQYVIRDALIVILSFLFYAVWVSDCVQCSCWFSIRFQPICINTLSMAKKQMPTDSLFAIPLINDKHYGLLYVKNLYYSLFTVHNNGH